MKLDLGNIVYYIILGGFFIYSIVKKTRKKADTSTPPPADNLPDFDKYLKEIIGKNKEEKSTQPVKKEVHSRKLKKTEKLVKVSDQAGKSSLGSELEAFTFEGEDAIKDNGIGQEPNITPNTSPIEDLRQAFIHYAILSPPPGLKQ